MERILILIVLLLLKKKIYVQIKNKNLKFLV